MSGARHRHRRLHALVVDYGGVLTTSVTRSFRAACRHLGLPPEAVREAIVEAYAGADGDGSAVALLETGRISVEDFAARLAVLLEGASGVRIDPEGLLRLLFAEVELDDAMLAAVAAVRAAGVRTALLSNSWGEDGYPRERFPELFDVVVISGEVGLRKPDPAIYALVAERLGVPPQHCLFVDDFDLNVRAAEAAGMHGLVHAGRDETLPAVARLLGVAPELLGMTAAQPEGGQPDDGAPGSDQLPGGCP